MNNDVKKSYMQAQIHHIWKFCIEKWYIGAPFFRRVSRHLRFQDEQGHSHYKGLYPSSNFLGFNDKGYIFKLKPSLLSNLDKCTIF